jgi:hypothetical protein
MVRHVDPTCCELLRGEDLGIACEGLVLWVIHELEHGDNHPRGKCGRR